MVHIPNCAKLKWSCMTHFGIFAWEEIKLQKMKIKKEWKFIFEAQNSIMMNFLKNMVTTYQFDVLLNNFELKKCKR